MSTIPRDLFINALKRHVGCEVSGPYCIREDDKSRIKIYVNPRAPWQYLDFSIQAIASDGGYVIGRCIGTVNGSTCVLKVKLTPEIEKLLEKIAEAMKKAMISPEGVASILETMKLRA